LHPQREIQSGQSKGAKRKGKGDSGIIAKSLYTKTKILAPFICYKVVVGGEIAGGMKKKIGDEKKTCITISMILSKKSCFDLFSVLQC
jgi:hypothetical protein